MAGKQRFIVLVLVLAAAAFLLLRPYLTQLPGEGGFTTTQNPRAAMEEALASGVPLFIEFYSDN